MAQASSSGPFQGLRPRWAQPSHPVYHREVNGWSRSRRLRLLRIGCAPLAFLTCAGIGLLCGLTTFGTDAAPQERLLIWSIIILWALLVGQAFITLATNLMAAALSATVISGELESRTYHLLRVTDIPTHEIILAKYAAALRQLRAPLTVIVGVRLFIIGGVLATLDFALRIEGTTGGLLETLGEIPAELISLLSVSTALLVGLGWLAYFLLEPVLTTVLFGSVGLFASSITRTRISGIITAGGLLVVLLITSSIVGQVLAVGSQLMLGSVLNSNTLAPWLQAMIMTRPATAIALGNLIPLTGLLVTVGWQAILIYLLVRAAVQRAYHLPYE